MAGVGADGLQLTNAVDVVDPAQRRCHQRPIRSLDDLVEVMPIGPRAHHGPVALGGNSRLPAEILRRHHQCADPTGTPGGAMDGGPHLGLLRPYRSQPISLGQLRSRERVVEIDQAVLQERGLNDRAVRRAYERRDQMVIGLHHDRGTLIHRGDVVVPREDLTGELAVRGVDMPLEVGAIEPTPGHDGVIAGIPQGDAPVPLPTGDGMPLPREIAHVPATVRCPRALHAPLHGHQVARSGIVLMHHLAPSGVIRWRAVANPVRVPCGMIAPYPPTNGSSVCPESDCDVSTDRIHGCTPDVGSDHARPGLPVGDRDPTGGRISRGRGDHRVGARPAAPAPSRR